MKQLYRWWRKATHREITLERLLTQRLKALSENIWMALASSPSADIVLARPIHRAAWTLFRTRLFRRGTNCIARVRFDTGGGFDERPAVELFPTRRGVIDEVIRLPRGTCVIRWEPVQAPGHFEQTPLRIVRIPFVEAFVRMWARVIHMKHVRPPRQLAEAGVSYRRSLRELTDVYRAAGHLRSHMPSLPYRAWVERFDTLSEDDRREIRRHGRVLPRAPLISVLMPVYNTPLPLLRRAIDSVRHQLYPEWELCIADDASTDPGVREVLADYAVSESRIRVVCRETNGHISAASNSALALACGEYVALLDHDDMLAEHALYLVALEILAHPDAVLVYSDSDKVDAFGQRFDPHFKPDWNPQLLLSQNFVCHLGVYRTQRVREVGGFRPGFDGSQDYDLALRVVEGVPAGAIRHVPAVLYHWGAVQGSTAVAVSEKPYAWEAGRRALADCLKRSGVPGEVLRVRKTAFYRTSHRLNAPRPKVSIIIPTRDAFDTLRRCVNSVLRKTTYPNYEIIVVDNQTCEPRARRYLERLKTISNIRVMRYDHPFNYSAINNLAAAEAEGEVLCLLNNDTEVITPNWLQDMLGYLRQKDVGVVGARLLYPDGTLQHAGILLHPRNIAVHAHAGLFKREFGYFGRATLAQDFMAVTGACLMVWKRVYERVGGLDAEHLPVAFNDVDFCLRVRDIGLRVVWTPFAELYHHESLSRGQVDTASKHRRFRRERRYMRRRWHALLESDPFYNPNLSLERLDFSVSDTPRLTRPWRTQRQQTNI